jgi:hypothetical protein
MLTAPRLIERHTGIIDLVIPNKANALSYSVGSGNTLDNTFAGSTFMFTVTMGGSFRSPTLKRNKKNRVEESNLGLTRLAVDLGDYASASIPGDGATSYFRVSEIDHVGNTGPEGPILVVPPPGFFSFGRKVLPLFGTAPNVAAGPTFIPPVGAMNFVLPKFTDNITINNDSAADSLWVSFSPGMQELEIKFGERAFFTETGISQVFLRGDGATVPFRAVFTLVNGLLA